MALTTTPYRLRGIPFLNQDAAKTTGNIFWVCNASGKNGSDDTISGRDPSRPFATVDYAVGQCTASQGDTIYVMPGHAETLTAAAPWTIDVAGLTWVFLGSGANRPTFTMTPATATGVPLAISAANTKFIGDPLFITGTDAVSKPINITGAGADLSLTWRDPAAATQAETIILTGTGADRLRLDVRYEGLTTGGTAPVSPIKLNGCNKGRIYLDFYGKASTAVVEFVTTLCNDIEVYGYAYNATDTTGAKLVVDTIGSSVWFAKIDAGAAGGTYSGGSGQAMASDDVSSVSAQLNVPTADVTTNTNERDVIGNKTDAAVTAVGTTKSIAAYAKGLVTMNTVQSADSTNNAFAGDVVGNKTDASVYVPGTTKSIAAYAKGVADLQERVASKAAATMTNGQTLFTIAGGAIKIESLVSECVTANDGTASTLQYNCAPTVGSAQTISAASASLANAAAGATVTLAGTSLATAALYNANGPNLIANPGTVIAPAGTITAVVGIGSTTGTWKHYIRYKPLAVGVTVS